MEYVLQKRESTVTQEINRRGLSVARFVFLDITRKAHYKRFTSHITRHKPEKRIVDFMMIKRMLQPE